MKNAFALILAATTVALVSLSATEPKPGDKNVPADPGWPRQRTNEQGRLVYYQPQVDEWKNFKEINFRMAFTLTPKGQKQVVGIMVLQAQTDVDVDEHTVLLSNFKFTEVTLPSVAAEKKSETDQLVRSFLPPGHTVVMSLDRLVATVEKSKAAPASVNVQNDPPVIFVSKTPAVLLHVDGEPVRSDIAGTKLGFVVNSNFPLFFEKEAGKEYYLFAGEQWLKAGSLEGPWSPAPKLPGDMYKVASDPKWTEMAKPILALSTKEKPPAVFYTNKPAEVIVFKGEPSYASIPGTQLSHATNTEADLFVYNTTHDFYYLTAGRWFRAADLKGPWTYAGAELPPDFANIPEDNPAARVLVSVPGTDEAGDAVLLAQVPTTVQVDPVKAAAEAKVTYNGDPEFKPIQGTSLSYAANTPDKVIKVGDVYYLCLQGVWFMSPNAKGPWTTAKTVPKEIYSIPSSSPVYNVTYVTQSTSDEGTVEASYTAGYVGSYIVGGAAGYYLASGTGYYYSPYYGYPIGGYPIYYPYAATYGVGSFYNPYSGAYGVAHGVYGPYGGAAAARSYNPYTGTYARGATAYGPYGSRSAAQAYNPYTGTYAASRQGSTAYGSWGQSVVSKGDRSAFTQHASNANGTIGSVQGSKGGGVIGASTDRGNSFAGKTAGGDMFAGRNGNVYKNTGDGWNKYEHGSWSSVKSPSSTSVQDRVQNSNRASGTYRASDHERSFNRSGAGSGFRDVDRDFSNRQRGGASSERFNNFQRSGGGGRNFSGGARPGGGRAGGGRRR
jgi:hypothetical protein